MKLLLTALLMTLSSLIALPNVARAQTAGATTDQYMGRQDPESVQGKSFDIEDCEVCKANAVNRPAFQRSPDAAVKDACKYSGTCTGNEGKSSGPGTATK